MVKIFKEAQVKELLSAVTREQISFSRMVEQLNAVAEYHAKEVAREALKNASKNVTMKKAGLRPPLGQLDYIGTHHFVIDEQSILDENNIPI